MVIAYILQNPVRAGMVKDFLTYQWSSAMIYFQTGDSWGVDRDFVERLFGNRDQYLELVGRMDQSELPIKKTREGQLIGGEDFYLTAKVKFDRRLNIQESLENKRIGDNLHFHSAEQVLWEYEREFSVKIDKIDTSNYAGKRQRAMLLMHLRDRAGMKYSEIIRLPLFSDLKYSSLGCLYFKAKKQMKNPK